MKSRLLGYKKSIAILSLGTFLEYFDLYLYIHMAILLDDLFFPCYDKNAVFLSQIAFASSFIMRPIGALIFGWIGDNIGRKSMLILTSIIMSICCFVLGNAPTYLEKGIIASWIILFCRMFQGISSLGECMGTIIYLTETLKSPYRYIANGIISIAIQAGGLFALLVATFVLHMGFNWRNAFYFGLSIFLITLIIRKSLKESPKFSSYKRNKKHLTNQNIADLNSNIHTCKKIFISYFVMELMYPIWFCILYVYCANILKNSFDFNNVKVIEHNTIIATISLLAQFGWTYVMRRIHPLKLAKLYSSIFLIFSLILPFLLNNIHSSFELLLIQIFISVFYTISLFLESVYCMYFHVSKRLTYSSMCFAIGSGLGYTIASILLPYLSKYFGHYALLFICFPITITFTFSIVWVQLKRVTLK